MFRKLCIILAVFVFLGLGTCGVSKSPYPHIAPDLPVYADYYEEGPYIEIQVDYERGFNTTEDETIVRIFGYGWNNCDRITVYVNDMRVKVYDPRRDDWVTTVEFTSIPGECSIRVKGSATGWSNYCYFEGAPEGATYALIQPTIDSGVVGTSVGIAALNWFPRGLVTIYFNHLAMDRLYPAQVWSSEFKVPELPAGLWPVEVRDESVSNIFNFEVIPSLAIEPVDVAPGQLMTIVGHGFAASRYVHLTTVDKIVFTDTHGSFRLEEVPCPSDSFILMGLDEEDNAVQLEINVAGATGANVVSAIPSTEPTIVTVPSTINLRTVAIGVVSLVIILCLIAIIVTMRFRKR